MDKSMNFIPENDVQEMYELQGRVYAAEVYIRSVTFPDRDVLLDMLGAEPDKVTALKRELEESSAALEQAYEKIAELEAELEYEDGILIDDDDPLGLVCADYEETDDFLFDEYEGDDLSEEADDNE